MTKNFEQIIKGNNQPSIQLVQPFAKSQKPIAQFLRLSIITFDSKGTSPSSPARKFMTWVLSIILEIHFLNELLKSNDLIWFHNKDGISLLSNLHISLYLLKIIYGFSVQNFIITRFFLPCFLIIQLISYWLFFSW